eukprot:m.119739 g.119739  ORF g.119739 m.119739 type:complete len:183 (-) comp28758_c0_seq2:264-812(-)
MSQPLQTTTNTRGSPYSQLVQLNNIINRRQSMFGQKLVHELRCDSCARKLCSRAMRALLLADTKTQLYSTDTSPHQGCACIGAPYATKSCDCKIQDVACIECGNEVGYHVVQACPSCLKACNNGHFWMFHGRSVRASERPNTERTAHLTWASIPSPANDDGFEETRPQLTQQHFLETIVCIR